MKVKMRSNANKLLHATQGDDYKSKKLQKQTDSNENRKDLLSEGWNCNNNSSQLRRDRMEKKA